jgi:hypothetical protein
MVGCLFNCWTMAHIASPFLHSYYNVPSKISSAMALSPLCPSSLPISVNPKEVAPAWLNCSTFLAIRWCYTLSLPSIFVQVVLWSVLGLMCPLIWRPIFLHDPRAVFLLSQTLTSFSTKNSFSTG